MKKSSKSTVEEKTDKIVLDKFSSIKTINNNNIFSKCHSFKLLPSILLRDISPFKKDPMVVTIEHCHIFHTFDSYGREQKTTNSVGGHYHEIELSVVDGEWKSVCSRPLSNKASNELLKNDIHTHELQYLKSGEVQIRTINKEAASMINDMMNKEA